MRYLLKLLWFVCKVALNIGVTTVIFLHDAAYFSFRVFLSCVHYQHGVSTVCLPGHLHLFHIDWG